jgi:hypothetical protein
MPSFFSPMNKGKEHKKQFKTEKTHKSKTFKLYPKINKPPFTTKQQ